MYELYIQDTSGTWQLADLGTSLPAINIQRNDLGELKDRQTDYSQALKLPITPTNCKIFGFVNEFSTTTNVRYNYLDCRLYIDSAEIVGTGGKVKITQITDSIEVQIIGGIVGFFTLLEGKNNDGDQKTLNDLTFKDSSGNPISIIRGIAGFQASTDPDNADVFFGIADFAEEVFTYNYSHYKNIMEYTYQYPVVKYKKIIEQILLENGGYTLETNLDNNIKYKNACIPFGNIQQKITDYSPNIQSTPISQAYNKDNTMTVGKFKAQSTGIYQFRLILSMSERHSDNAYPYYFQVFINNILQGTVFYSAYSPDMYKGDEHVVYLFNPLPSDTDNSVELNMPLVIYTNVNASTGGVTTNNKFSLAKDDELEVIFYLYYAYHAAPITRSFGTGLITNISYGGTPKDGKIPLTGNLPAKTQYDFFKDFLQMYGLTVDVDENNKIVYAHTFDKIIQNKANANDWSKKYNKNSGTEKNTLGSYVQTNYIKYADQTNELSSETFTAISEDVAEYYFNKGKPVWYDDFYDEEGTSVSGIKYPITGTFTRGKSEYYALSFLYKDTDTPIIDRGQLTINNTTLSEQPADMITFLAETTKNILRTRSDSMQYYYAKIKRLSSGEFPDDPSMRLLIFRTEGGCDCEDIYIVNDDSTGKPATCTTLGNPVTLYALSTQLMAHTVNGVQYQSLSIDAQSMVEEFYGAFQEHVLSDVRLIEDAEFYLTPQDIQEYDPFTPVYIDTFGAYFYINKIKNFVSGKLTKVDLVRI